ncbi:MAG TPA: winged helix-turn-helix domain-containing protein [Planktothrix sp.]
MNEQLVVGDIEMDTGRHTVIRNGKSVDLLPLEFSLLEFFLRNQGRVFPAEALLERVWPAHSERSTEAVRTAIKTLRRKIDRGCDRTVIRTIHGVGYKLEI